MTIKALALRIPAVFLAALLVGCIFGVVLYNTAGAYADVPLLVDAGPALAAAEAQPAELGGIVTSPVALPVDSTPGVIADAAVDAAAAGKWFAALLLLLAAAVAVVRVLWARARTRVGGWIANFTAGALLLLGASAAAGEPLSLSLVISSVILSLSAAGGVTLAQDVRSGLRK